MDSEYEITQKAVQTSLGGNMGDHVPTIKEFPIIEEKFISSHIDLKELTMILLDVEGKLFGYSTQKNGLTSEIEPPNEPSSEAVTKRIGKQSDSISIVVSKNLSIAQSILNRI